MSAIPRPMPAKCEVCRFYDATRGVGFPSAPGAVPGLPDVLRGARIWICECPDCERQAQTRALRAARHCGARPSKIWHITVPQNPRPIQGERP